MWTHFFFFSFFPKLTYSDLNLGMKHKQDIVVHKEFCSSLWWNSTTSHWKGHKAGDNSHHVSVVKVQFLIFKRSREREKKDLLLSTECLLMQSCSSSCESQTMAHAVWQESDQKVIKTDKSLFYSLAILRARVR